MEKSKDNRDELFDVAIITGLCNPTEESLDAFRKFVDSRPKLTNAKKLELKRKYCNSC